VKPEEEYVKKSLELFFKEDLTIVEGEDPPDYYVIRNGNRIQLEVTLAESKYKNNGRVENARTSDTSILRLCDKLNNEIGSKVDLQYSLLLDVKGPVKMNFDKFKKELKSQLISFLNDKNHIAEEENGWERIKVLGEEVGLKFLPYSPPRKRIIGIVSLKMENTICNIEEHASIVLNQIIEIKEKKTSVIKGVKWEGEKWLAILNNYWLASSDTYFRAMECIQLEHSFSKIYIIGDNSEVTEIFSK
jgi:hypothetical protein